MKYLLIGFILTTGVWFSSMFQQEEPEAPSVVIKRTSDGHLVAAVKNHPSYRSTLFILQTTQVPSNFSPVTMGNANIQFSDRCVQFSSAEQTVIFKLIDETCSSTGSGTNLTIYGGYGLVNQKDQGKYDAVLNFTGPVLPPVEGILRCRCIPNGQQAPGTCLAGGAGSTGCSYNLGGGATIGGVGGNVQGECSTSCSQGYYSCCYWE